jgi:hypothetical protein
MDYVTLKEEIARSLLQFDAEVKEFVRKYGMEAYSKEVEVATADAKPGRIDLKELDYLIFFKKLRQKEIIYPSMNDSLRISSTKEFITKGFEKKNKRATNKIFFIEDILMEHSYNFLSYYLLFLRL